MKRSGALLCMKDFSIMADVDQTTLRYWVKIGLFCPVQRDRQSRHRYYSSQQIIFVNFIKVLTSLKCRWDY